MPSERRPLIVFGLDVGDAAELLAGAASGRLPQLARILRSGFHARTTGPELVCEHGLWATLVSGVSRCEHGYYYFRELQAGRYALAPRRDRDLGLRPFWARSAAPRALIMDVPGLGIEPSLAGIQVVDCTTHYPDGPPAGQPESALREALMELGPARQVGERLESSPEVDRRIRSLLLDRIARRSRLLDMWLAREAFDMVFLVCSETHTASHQFWRYRPAAGERPAGTDDLAGTIGEVYAALDAQLGRILGRLPDANVVVVSSTGMEDHYPTGGLIESVLRGLGYEAPAAPMASALGPLRAALPEAWRAFMSQPLPRRIQERLLSDKFRSRSDWTRTTAFAIPSYYTSFVRVNLAGREPLGVVKQEDYARFLDGLEADLRLLVDPKTGAGAVLRVERAVDLFGGGPPAQLPDLFVEWQPVAHFVDAVVHPRGRFGQTRPDFYRGSDHAHEGFLAMAGPSVEARGDRGGVSALDLAPTCLALLGAPSAPGLRGRSLV